jgi:hypothetical protein
MMTLTPDEYQKGYNQGCQDAAPKPRIALLGVGKGVCIGGRFDGWLMRKHPDGQWVSEAKLESEDPMDNDFCRMLLGTVKP